MSSVSDVQAALHAASEPERVPLYQRYFKTGPGDYAEGDRFRGVRVPRTRAVAKAHRALPLADVIELLHSEWHEDRLCALVMLVDRYRRSDAATRNSLTDLYLRHRSCVNHWDLVDTSAMHLLGPALDPSDTSLLMDLASSDVIWDRRIAVISTFALIRKKEYRPSLQLCENLLTDRHDLMHKAYGWVLREIGNRDIHALRAFLVTHSSRMPRTMLRYAIEKLDAEERRHWMNRSV